MRKKPSGSSKISVSPASKKPPSKIEDIHTKIVNSSALNGGFDTLLFKIDKIEQSQGQLVAKVDKIHDAIYSPKDGLFSQISEHKLESTVKLNEINPSIAEVNTWKKYHEEDRQEDDENAKELETKVKSLEKSVDSLSRSKDQAWTVLKWFAVALGGGLITLFFSWVEGKLK